MIGREHHVELRSPPEITHFFPFALSNFDGTDTVEAHSLARSLARYGRRVVSPF